MRPKFTIQYYCDKPVPFPNFIPFSYIFQINQGKKFVPFSNQCWGPTDWSVQMVSPCMIVRIFCLSHLPFMCVDLSFVLMFAFNKYLQYFSFYYHNESGIVVNLKISMCKKFRNPTFCSSWTKKLWRNERKTCSRRHQWQNPSLQHLHHREHT